MMYVYNCGLIRLLCLSILIFGILVTITNFSRVFAADLTGTNRDDTLYLYGNGGNDKISGDPGDDLIQGDPGDDTLNGNDGNDMILGGTGGDKIDGGNGDDYLVSSYVIGSTSISDGKADTLTCGPGIDTAFINPLDGDTAAADCEIVVSTP